MRNIKAIALVAYTFNAHAQEKELLFLKGLAHQSHTLSPENYQKTFKDMTLGELQAHIFNTPAQERLNINESYDLTKKVNQGRFFQFPFSKDAHNLATHYTLTCSQLHYKLSKFIYLSSYNPLLNNILLYINQPSKGINSFGMYWFGIGWKNYKPSLPPVVKDFIARTPSEKLFSYPTLVELNLHVTDNFIQQEVLRSTHPTTINITEAHRGEICVDTAQHNKNLFTPANYKSIKDFYLYTRTKEEELVKDLAQCEFFSSDRTSIVQEALRKLVEKRNKALHILSNWLLPFEK